MKTKRILFRLILFITLASMIPSCAVNPVTGKRQFMIVTEEQEKQMGLQYDPLVISTFGEYKADNMLNFLQSKAVEIGKISHRPKVEFTVRILDSPVVNAFAVPGGFVYFTRGILAQMNNEAELVGVLGHEMGHITARHSASQQSRQQLGQLLLIGGMIASPKFAEYAEATMQGMQLLFLKFSRDDESQSDELGVEYSTKVGYDAHKMADFFQVLQKMSMAESSGGVPTFMSTHPDPGDRFTEVNKDASAWQKKHGAGNYKINQESYLKMIDGMIYGEDPRQGYTEGNTFYHPQMKFLFSYPDGWQIQNQPTQVMMAPKDGKALMIFTISPQKALQAAADSAIRQFGLQLADTKKTTINNLPALVTLSKQVSQDQSTGQQAVNYVMSSFIDYSGTIYVFHSVSAEADFKTYSPAFESTMKTFASLTDPSKLNVRPTKIIVKAVQKPGTLADAFRSLNVPQEKMNELALLNNMELTAKVDAGRLIKITGN